MTVTAAQFAKFLSQSAEITRRQPVRLDEQTKGSGGFQYSESELAEIKGTSVGFSGSSDGPLLEVKRPGQPPARPVAPDEIEQSEATEQEWSEYLEARRKYEEAFRKFLAAQRQYRAHNALYQNIFRSRDEGDGNELVLGIVHLRSDNTAQETLDRPITILELLVELNEQTGSLAVVPAASVRNELGWLPLDLRGKFRDAAEKASALENAYPHDLPESIKALINVLGTDFAAEPGRGADYLIEVDYVLAYRKQTTTAISVLMQDMEDAFDSGEPPTEAYKALLEHDLGSAEPGSASVMGSLPLAASSIQEDIVKHALHNPLTVVLGPPGTGKTHTIANTAAALIGSGKRVLITSERELPLLEVQDKLPESMQPLLLPIFGRGNVSALAKASAGIVEKQSTSRAPSDRVQRIEDLRAKVEQLKEDQIALRRQLSDAAGRDSSPIEIDGTELPLKSWVQRFREDERTALFDEGGLMGLGGSLDKQQAEALLSKISSLQEDHLSHAVFDFPSSLQELISGPKLRGLVGPLEEELNGLGPLDRASAAHLAPWADQLERVGKELSETTFPSLEFHEVPGVNVLSRSCKEAKDLLGAELDAPDLLSEAAILRAGTEQAERAQQALRRDTTGYLEQFVKDTDDTRSSQLRTLIEESRQFQFRRRPIHSVVELTGNHSPIKLLEQAETLRGHLESGGKFKTLFGVPNEVKQAQELLECVRVNENEINSKGRLAEAIEYLQAEKDAFNTYRWAEGQGFEGQQGEVQDWIEEIQALPKSAHEIRQRLHRLFVDANDWANKPLDTTLSELLDRSRSLADHKINPADHITAQTFARSQTALLEAVECLPDAWQPTVLADGLDSNALIVGLQALTCAAAIGEEQSLDVDEPTFSATAKRSRADLRREELQSELEAHLANARAPLASLGQKSPGVQGLLAAIESQDLAAYEAAWAVVNAEHTFWLAGVEYHKAFAVVSAQYPILAEALRAEADEEREAARKVLADIEQLQVRRAGYERVLEALSSMPDFDEVNSELQNVLTKRRNAEAELAEAQCWHAALLRLEANPAAITGINSMRVAAQQVPKTKTAKSYPARLQQLRNAMTRALPGMPGVVMKMERCAELIGLPDSPEKKFDVAIVDEASQSLFTALFVFGLADRVIIVGDNYQISPSVPFGNLLGLQMTELAKALIADHPDKNAFSADYSLFDAALSMSKPHVMTEHFRCDPQIIELSNILSYEPNGITLQPVKAPNPDNPDPVQLHYVEDGTLDDENINKNEAAAVVSKVLDVIDDQPESTLGVVVLGSRAQVRYLSQEILDSVGPEEAVRRKLQVGTAEAFQGSERDVIILSLVDAPTVDEPVLRRKPQEFTGQNRWYVQELNVAVSRAKNELHIFHSFRSSELKEGDVRGILLAAAKKTAPKVSDEVEIQKADSQFEIDVFNAVRSRLPNARLRTQVPAVGYKIDLVVEHNGKEVAIECDGDRWHTSPNDMIRDTHRQRLLESLGWTFVRFLASQWYRPNAQEYWLDRIEEELAV